MPKLPLRVLFMHGLEGGPKGIKVGSIISLVPALNCSRVAPLGLR